MSELVSAFAAYKANGVSSKLKKSSRKSKSGGLKKSKSNTNTSGKKAEKKNILNKMPTNVLATKNKDANVPKSKAAETKSGKASTNIKHNATQNGTAKPTNKKVLQKANKSVDSEINESEITHLVEELFDSDKKLTKAQEKKKEKLERYLIDQLQSGQLNGSSSVVDSDIYEDEYTLNSEYDSEEETGSDSYTDEEVESGDGFSLDALKKVKSTASKRKSDDDETTATSSQNVIANSSMVAKKSKTEVAARKSLPALKTKNDKTKLQSKSSEGSTVASGSLKNIKCTPHKVSADIKLEPLSPPHSFIKMNSIKEGEKMLRWLLNPIDLNDFYSTYWEKNACFIKRQHANYFSSLISFEAIDKMLLKNHIEFTKNIDVTSYKNGVRQTHNPDGRAMPPVVWEHYGKGCSIRLLNPQTYIPAVYTLNASLQEYFHCMVGANAYLTPPNSQGFAPHYDDIEAFVLQIEGRKRWKLYKPLSSAEMLPRVSSKNFKQEEIGEPIMDQVLHPGDVLYFPRGVIHQACTEPGYHSLHLTISVYQKQSYADLFERMMPMILQHVVANNIDMRRGLPLHTWQHAGIVYSDNDTRERADLLKNVSKLLNKCVKDLPLGDILDAAVDQVAKKYQHEALPPELHPSENIRTIFGSRNRTNENGECICDDYEINLSTNVRPLRANIMRLVNEDEKLRVYYYLNNSKEYCEYEPNFLEIESDDAGMIEVLIKSYPEYCGVDQLPCNNNLRKIEVVTALFELGLLMLEKPIN